MKKINDIILEKLSKIPNIIILILFWIEYCVPCEIMKNNIKNFEKQYKKKIRILKININYNKYTSEKFFIKSTPTLTIIKNKKILIKKQGILNKENLKKILKKILN